MTDVLLRTRLEGAQQVQQGLAGITSEFDKMQAGAVALGATIGATLGMAAYNAAARFAHFVKESVNEFADYGERLEKIQQQTGLAVETLSQIDFVAKNNKMSLESVATGFRSFARQVEAANDGNKRSIDTMRALGISMSDLRNLNTDELFRKAVTELGRMSDGTERAALAVRSFGIAGRNMQVIAGQFKEGADEADRLGYTMSDRALVAASKLDNQMDALDRRFDVTRRILAVELAPAITLVFDGFNSLFDYLRKNAPSIGESTAKAMRQWREVLVSTKQDLTGLAATWEFATSFFTKPEGALAARWDKFNDKLKKAREDAERELFGIATTVEETNWPGRPRRSRGVGAPDDAHANKQAEDEAHKRYVNHLETEAHLMKQAAAELKSLTDARERDWKEQEKAMQALAATEAADVAAKSKQREAFEDLADPMRVFARQLELIDELQRKYGLSAEAAAAATKKAAEDMERSSGKIKEKSPWDDLLREVEGFGKQLTNSLYGVIAGTENAFQGLVKSIGEIISKKILEETISRPFIQAIDEVLEKLREAQKEAGGGFSGLISAVGGFLGKAIGGVFGGGTTESTGGGGYFGGIDITTIPTGVTGSFQHGGYIPPGYSALVGEGKGIEMVRAGKHGATVTPLGRGGDSFNMEWHIAAGVTRAELLALIPKIKSDTMSAVFDAKRRGGRFASS